MLRVGCGFEILSYAVFHPAAQTRHQLIAQDKVVRACAIAHIGTLFQLHEEELLLIRQWSAKVKEPNRLGK
jgi:hypothetical protein